MKDTELKNPPILVQLLLAFGLAVLCGCTIMVMWNWYIVPLGLPMIGMIHALGIDMLVTFIVTTKPGETTQFWERWIYSVLYALMTLFFGWLLHLAM